MLRSRRDTLQRHIMSPPFITSSYKKEYQAIDSKYYPPSIICKQDEPTTTVISRHFSQSMSKKQLRSLAYLSDRFCLRANILFNAITDIELLKLLCLCNSTASIPDVLRCLQQH